MTISSVFIAAGTVLAWLHHGKSYTPPSVKPKLDSLYKSTLVCGAALHILPMLGLMTISQGRESMIDTFFSALGTMFIPPRPWGYPITSPTADLMFDLFKWDNVICSLAMVGYPKLYLTVLWQSILIGPYAASVMVLAKRDKISEIETLTEKND
ncbi:uncharacterized protein N7479_001366 [Penicillium vulpinum]|nr:uncharacterized protein N7479_001366 [Penicillium vulpinum]KAJ5971448.1 hypothetical protein N7479_001366 [Penicillium vulpinum]